MKITEAQLRKIIRKELLKESKPREPVAISDFSFAPDSSGSMSLPVIGASISVRSLEDFEKWKSNFLEKYGDGFISWDHNGWNIQNEKFKASRDAANKRFMSHHRDMERRLGRKLRY